jgi:hypothetical protein
MRSKWDSSESRSCGQRRRRVGSAFAQPCPLRTPLRLASRFISYVTKTPTPAPGPKSKSLTHTQALFDNRGRVKVEHLLDPGSRRPASRRGGDTLEPMKCVHGLDHEVAIIVRRLPSGIGTAAALRRAGIDDYVLLEQGDERLAGPGTGTPTPGSGSTFPPSANQFSYAQSQRALSRGSTRRGGSSKGYAGGLCVETASGCGARIRPSGTEVTAARFET